ncbi:MAG: hypothetical protein HY939_01965 [Gammaproteobacteria bacterium]|nr:hypothetical protein [Gammaproteobacteria bacterium]
MTVLTRDDGTQFAINSYRETLVVKKTSILKKEIRTLSHIHGKFAKFRYRDERQRIEAAFSSDQGYILGLLIWRHFNKPSNFIYCEALPHSENAILVIMHDLSFYLETEIPKANIITELASLLLLGEKAKFDIYISGDVPIAQTPTEGKFAFDKSAVNLFQVLPPVFPTLEATPDTLLLPVEEAIKELELPESYAVPALIALAVIVLGGYFWRTTHPREAARITPSIETPYFNPYKQLQAALSSPSPEHILMTVCDQLDTLLSLPGWVVSKIVYTPNTLSVTLMPMSASHFRQLETWAIRAHYNLEPKTGGGAILTQTLHLPVRTSEAGIYSSSLGTYAALYDSINRLFPYVALTASTSKNNGTYIELSTSINFQNISVTLLRQMSHTFSRQPIAINAINLTTQSGLISGSIKFSIFGAS